MSAPQPSADILAWAKKQPAWRQDVLRRILTKSFTKTDEDECLELLKAEHGIIQSKLKSDPLDAKHLPVRSASATNLRLVALDDIANVNRLAKDAALSLASGGLTLIYGDNGSGKSGFIRILKKACRARDDEAILPDVYATKRANSPASARFTVEEGTTKLAPIAWFDDGKPSADVLGRLAIFDSKCASVHVDGENRLEIVPHNLDCGFRRRRTAVPIEGGQYFRSIADSIPMITDRHSRRRQQGGHGAGLASSPDRLAAALRMLSPFKVSLWALWTSRSRMASATVGLAIASCQ